MTPRHRLIILLIFVAIFVLITPALMMYLMGYRYNLPKRKIEQVGVLIADTLPKDTILRLNNAQLAKTRPARLASLKPNYYLLLAEHEGYYGWQKNIEIKSRETTIFYDIALFKQSSPTILQSDNIEIFDLSPKEDYVAYFKENNLWINNLETGTSAPFYQSAFRMPPERKIKWSPDNKLILLEEKKDGAERAVIIDSTKKENLINLGSFIGPRLTNLAWSDNSDRLYGTFDNKLYAVNIKSRSFEKLAQDVDSFAVIGSTVFLTKKTSKETTVYKYQLLNIFSDNLSRLASLPPAHYQILTQKNNFLALSNVEENLIYLADLSDSAQPLLRLNGKYAIWGNGAKNNYLYYYDDSELGIFDPNTKQTSLLLRYSNNIRRVLPVPQIPYFIIQTDKNIQIGELDDRDQRQIITAFEGKEIFLTALDKKGKTVYFTDKLRKGNSLFKLDIQ